MSAELVGPLRQIRFRDGAQLVADPPRNTLDLRWVTCSNHHTACDCREAELSEEISEHQGMLTEAEKAAQRILAGHPFRIWSADGNASLGCQCTGCQLARAAHLYLRLDGNGVVLPLPDGA